MNVYILLFYWSCLSFIYATTNENAISFKENFSDDIIMSDTVAFVEDQVPNIEYKKPIFPPFFFGLKNDSIFKVRIYYHPNTTMIIDSLVIVNIFVPIDNRHFWTCQYDNGDIRICKFKKCRHFSYEYLNANADSYWEAEMEMRPYKLYNKDMLLIEEVKRFGKITIVKKYGNQEVPKKSVSP